MDTSYITSAQQAEQLPVFPWPEVAFIGRSNTGKSSLLNALLARNNLARTSSTPGRTQMVNFFGLRMGERQMVFADLPGYGYSGTGRENRRHWESLVRAYLQRPTIQEFLFLLDVRRAAKLADEDRDLIAYLGQIRPAVGLSIVLTKSDKVSQKELAATLQALKARLDQEGLNVKRVLPVSSLKKTGIEPLRRDLLRYLDAGQGS